MRKNLIRTTLVVAAIAACFFVLGSSKPATDEDSRCKESLEECCKKKQKNGKKFLWDNLTGQFFASTRLD
jgi:hypothetical protein